MHASRRPHIRIRLLAFASLAAGLACLPTAEAKAARHTHPHHGGTHLAAFKSDADLQAFLKQVQKRSRHRATAAMGEALPAPSPTPMPAPPAAPADAAAAPTESASPSQPSITNTQEANVDEGGIVKMHGDTLVILRRGRLFTVSTRDGSLKPIDSINAFPPGVDVSGDWYDEMLVSGDRVIVIGYSYGRNGTEINRFHISEDGKLAYEDTHHIRSNDYYSSRNYASRLIGSHLVVYSPLYLPHNILSTDEWLPAVRLWDNSSTHGAFKRTVDAIDIYRPAAGLSDAQGITALHTVTDCDLSKAKMHCTAKAVFGPSGRTFYVSPKAVYVWMSDYNMGAATRERPASSLYRLPLDGSAPTAISVRGAPTDQFSFREDGDKGVLNVLVRSEASGDAMWNPEFSEGSIALLQLPVSEMGDGDDEARKRFYRSLPTPKGDGYAFQNRFVGDHILYGMGSSWGSQGAGNSDLVVASLQGKRVSRFELSHDIDRIDALGLDAVVIGSDGKDLAFLGVELTDGTPRLGDRYVLNSASQGETRSQAFFFKPEPDAGRGDDSAGILGLPVARAARPGFEQLQENSAAVLFIRRKGRQFAPLGDLAARESGTTDDQCKASCVDWYGNSRPIFLGDRTFALMGYEIVEGTVAAKGIKETQRVSFAPGRHDD
jgi:hypothetical protein